MDNLTDFELDILTEKLLENVEVLKRHNLLLDFIAEKQRRFSQTIFEEEQKLSLIYNIGMSKPGIDGREFKLYFK